MKTPTVEQRAAQFEALASLYGEEPEQIESNLIDILTDAMHWCAANGIEFEQKRLMAEIHFEVETDKAIDDLP